MTDVALRDYFDQRLADLRREMVEGFRLRDEAIAKAERTMNERLSGMNEFRQTIQDQNKTMATRVEVEKIDRQVRDLEQSKANLDGRIAALVFSLATMISLITSGTVIILSHFWK